MIPRLREGWLRASGSGKGKVCAGFSASGSVTEGTAGATLADRVDGPLGGAVTFN